MVDEVTISRARKKGFQITLPTNVVIVFLVQCSQGSKEQTGHQNQEKKQCSLVNCLRWSAVKILPK